MAQSGGNTCNFAYSADDSDGESRGGAAAKSSLLWTQSCLEQAAGILTDTSQSQPVMASAGVEDAQRASQSLLEASLGLSQTVPESAAGAVSETKRDSPSFGESIAVIYDRSLGLSQQESPLDARESAVYAGKVFAAVANDSGEAQSDSPGLYSMGLSPGNDIEGSTPLKCSQASSQGCCLSYREIATGECVFDRSKELNREGSSFLQRDATLLQERAPALQEHGGIAKWAADCEIEENDSNELVQQDAVFGGGNVAAQQRDCNADDGDDRDGTQLQQSESEDEEIVAEVATQFQSQTQTQTQIDLSGTAGTPLLPAPHDAPPAPVLGSGGTELLLSPPTSSFSKPSRPTDDTDFLAGVSLGLSSGSEREIGLRRSGVSSEAQDKPSQGQLSDGTDENEHKKYVTHSNNHRDVDTGVPKEGSDAGSLPNSASDHAVIEEPSPRLQQQREAYANVTLVSGNAVARPEPTREPVESQGGSELATVDDADGTHLAESFLRESCLAPEPSAPAISPSGKSRASPSDDPDATQTESEPNISQPPDLRNSGSARSMRCLSHIEDAAHLEVLECQTGPTQPDSLLGSCSSPQSPALEMITAPVMHRESPPELVHAKSSPTEPLLLTNNEKDATKCDVNDVTPSDPQPSLLQKADEVDHATPARNIKKPAHKLVKSTGWLPTKHSSDKTDSGYQLGLPSVPKYPVTDHLKGVSGDESGLMDSTAGETHMRTPLSSHQSQSLLLTGDLEEMQMLRTKAKEAHIKELDFLAEMSVGPLGPALVILTGAAGLSVDDVCSELKRSRSPSV
jgi:hypothetical protein